MKSKNKPDRNTGLKELNKQDEECIRKFRNGADHMEDRITEFEK